MDYRSSSMIATEASRYLSSRRSRANDFRFSSKAFSILSSGVWEPFARSLVTVWIPGFLLNAALVMLGSAFCKGGGPTTLDPEIPSPKSPRSVL